MRSSINRSFSLAAAVTLLLAVPAHAQDQSKPPVPARNPGSWFTQADYPAAKRANQQGRVVLDISVDARGTVVGCTLVETSKSAELDGKSCELVRTRGTFKPALDPRGKPVDGLYARGGETASVPIDVTIETSLQLDGGPQWRMTYQAPHQIVTSLVIVHLEVDAEGRAQNCQVVQATGQHNRVDPCTTLPGPFVPPGTKRGVTMRVAVSHPRTG